MSVLNQPIIASYIELGFQQSDGVAGGRFEVVGYSVSLLYDGKILSSNF